MKPGHIGTRQMFPPLCQLCSSKQRNLFYKTMAFTSQQCFPHIANLTFSLNIVCSFIGGTKRAAIFLLQLLLVTFFFSKKHYARPKKGQSILSHISWFLPFFIGYRPLPVEGIADEEDDSVVETGGVSCCKVPTVVQ